MRPERLGPGRRRPVMRAVVFCGVTVVTVALAPVLVVVGEPLRRYYLRRLSRRPSGAHVRQGVARVIIANPVLIALTAPARWMIDQVGEHLPVGSSGRGFGRFRWPGGDEPPPAGVREPRRPLPGAPASAVALAEPRQQHRVRLSLKDVPRALSGSARRTRSLASRMSGLLRSLRRSHLGH